MELYDMEKCDRHLEREARGVCASCGDRLCDECISDRRGDIVLCFECAVKATAGDFEKWDREKKAEAERRMVKVKKPGREGIGGFGWFLIITLSIIALESGIIATDYFVVRRGEVSRISSNTITRRYNLDISSMNMHKISMAIERYKDDNGGSLPKDLSSLVPDYLDSVPADPVTGLDYEYSAGDGGYIVICSTPETHGMEYLKNVNGKLQYMKLEGK